MMDGNYIALAVALFVWLGLGWYLLRLDRRIKNLEDHRQ